MLTATIEGRPVRIRVLCVGTNRFPVRFAEKDATDVATVFAKRYGMPGATVRYLLRPTPAKLRAVLGEIAAEQPDIFVFFDSSHGSVSGFEVANEKQFSWLELLVWVRTIAATHSMIILDTCHAGAFAKLGALGGTIVGGIQPTFLELLARATPGTRVLCSVAANKNAGEGLGVNNGHLAAAIMQAIATAAGNLYGWIDDEEFCDLVSEISESRWGQRPETLGLTGNFPLLRAQSADVGAIPIVGTHFGGDGSLSVSALAMDRAGMPTVVRAELANTFGVIVARVDHQVVPKSDSEIVTATFSVPEHIVVRDGVSAWQLRDRRCARLTWRFFTLDLGGALYDDGQLPFDWRPRLSAIGL